MLLGGAALTETIFSWPGLGRFMIESIKAKDMPMVLGSAMFLAPHVLRSQFTGGYSSTLMLIRELKRNTAVWEGGRNVLRKALQDNSTTKSRSLWADAWRRFKKNKMAIISLVFLLPPGVNRCDNLNHRLGNGR